MNKPIISVPVIAYNSSNTIVETLESIKAQTYPNIELIISDDCSTDDTIQICEKWISENKERFCATKIIKAERNTGQAGNHNRALKACTGVWVKGIDADDLLLPNCLSDCYEYVSQNPEALYLFGRTTLFGGTEAEIKRVASWFNYDFFKLSIDEQLQWFYNKGNCIPASASFYNRDYVLSLGFKCDERVHYYEDLPKWIILLRKGVRFHFIDKDIVSYRASGGISTSRKSLKYFRTTSLFKMYYTYPQWLKDDYERGVKRIVDEQCDIYSRLLATEDRLALIENRYNKMRKIFFIDFFSKCFHFLRKVTNRYGK